MGGRLRELNRQDGVELDEVRCRAPLPVVPVEKADADDPDPKRIRVPTLEAVFQ